MIKIYGIKNCDKCRAAQKWFAAKDVDFSFHDLREDGLNDRLLKKWQMLAADGLSLNRRSQTWRKIPEQERTNLTASGERKLAMLYPTVLQRPIVVADNSVSIGYDESAWKKLL